jgi:exonuclease VII large subunit
VLGRGYALVRATASGAIVRRHDDVSTGDAIRIQLGEGRLAARVEAREPDPDAGAPE